MNCEETRKLLDGWVDREVSLETSLVIESHLESCGACSLLRDELEAARRSCARAMAYHGAPRRLDADIRRRLRQAQPAAPRSRRVVWLAVPLVAAGIAMGWLGAQHLPRGGEATTVVGAERVVFHVSSRDNLRGALRNVVNHLEASPHSRVVVVAHNLGVELLVEGARDENGIPYRPAVIELVKQGVDFRVCGNTLERDEYGSARLIPEATRVPSGIAEIARLQAREGFAYLRL